jgi:hypothetical protein
MSLNLTKQSTTKHTKPPTTKRMRPHTTPLKRRPRMRLPKRQKRSQEDLDALAAMQEASDDPPEAA